MDQKPADCTCRYPDVKFRNFSGHAQDCPCHRKHMTEKWAPQRGYRVLGFGPSGEMFVTKVNQAATEAYERVVAKTKDKTVTAADLNELIEALDKSTLERVARHLRVPKVGPKDISTAGRVVPKRQGINNPPQQHRGRRYAAGTAAKKRQNQDQSKAWQRKRQDTLRDDLLEQALRRPALSEQQVKVVNKIIQTEEWACPYCDQIISERGGLYHDGTNWYHRPCQGRGPIRLPPTDWSKIDQQWQTLLQAQD